MCDGNTGHGIPSNKHGPHSLSQRTAAVASQTRNSRAGSTESCRQEPTASRSLLRLLVSAAEERQFPEGPALPRPPRLSRRLRDFSFSAPLQSDVEFPGWRSGLRCTSSCGEGAGGEFDLLLNVMMESFAVVLSVHSSYVPALCVFSCGSLFPAVSESACFRGGICIN